MNMDEIFIHDGILHVIDFVRRRHYEKCEGT